MSSPPVRWLFIAVLILLPVQYALVGLVSERHREPWPTLVLPAFQKAWNRGEPIQVEQVALELVLEGGDRIPVPVEPLLAALPRSQHREFLRAQCQPASLSGTPRTERCLQPGAAAWVHQRLDALFPEQSFSRLDVIWNRLTYTPARPKTTPHRAVETAPLDTLSVIW